jgi:hypothetical protein
MHCLALWAHRMSFHHDFIRNVAADSPLSHTMLESRTSPLTGLRPFLQFLTTASDDFWQPGQAVFRTGTSQAAFPEQNYPPSGFLQVDNSLPIAPHIASKFCLPEFDIAGRCRGILAPLMPMPVTPVNEHHRAVSRKNEIRSTGQFFVMQSITQSLPMQKVSDQHFGLGILAANAGHHPRPDRRSNHVCHGQALFQLGTLQINCPPVVS